MEKKCLFCKKKFIPQYKSHRFCTLSCANRFNLNNKNWVSLPIQYTDKLAELFGILLGDGSVTKYFSKIFLNPIADKGYSKFVEKLCTNLFPGASISHFFRPKNGTEEIQISSKEVSDYLYSIGFNPVKRIVPKWIIAKDYLIKSTIRGLFDTEGSIGIKYFDGKGGKYLYKQLTFTNKNINLLGFIEKQLKNFGYSPTKKSAKNIYLSNTIDINRYSREIGSHNPKIIKKISIRNKNGFISRPGRGAQKGSVAERTNAPHLKCGKPAMASEVRILSLPPFNYLLK